MYLNKKDFIEKKQAFGLTLTLDVFKLKQTFKKTTFF